jgi:hypothetical protein
MPAPRFETVADALLQHATDLVEHLRTHGYRVRAEVADYAAPFTPTITARRRSTVLHVEVTGTIDLERMREWVAYGKSSGDDTRIAFCVPSEVELSNATVIAVRNMGVGLFVVDGGTVVESITAVDLAMNVELPKLRKQPTPVRQLLGHSYEQFGRGEWREGFEDACNALEEEARRYYAHWSRTGRIRVNSPSGPKPMTQAAIKRLTLGQLAKAFKDILTPNSLDVAIEQALSKVNPDRVERTHRRHQRRTEERLRKNVGKHMWLIVSVLKQMAE